MELRGLKRRDQRAVLTSRRKGQFVGKVLDKMDNRDMIIIYTSLYIYILCTYIYIEGYVFSFDIKPSMGWGLPWFIMCFCLRHLKILEKASKLVLLSWICKVVPPAMFIGL